MNVIGFRKAIIQCALPPEFEALKLVFKTKAVSRHEEFEFFETPSVVCFRAGMGETAAAKGAEYAMSKWKTRFYIDFGMAGALAPGLAVGDIVVAEEVGDVRGFTHEASVGLFGDIPAFPEFKIFEKHRVSRGKITCENMDIIFDDQRFAVYKQSGAVAVNWESAAIARVCSKNKIEFHSFRMISDTKESEVKAIRSPEMLRRLSSAADILAAAAQ